MKLLGKTKEKDLSNGQQRAAERIAGHILKGQRKAADYLNHLTAGISRRNWILLLVSFCLAFGMYCLSLLLQIL